MKQQKPGDYKPNQIPHLKAQLKALKNYFFNFEMKNHMKWIIWHCFLFSNTISYHFVEDFFSHYVAAFHPSPRDRTMSDIFEEIKFLEKFTELELIHTFQIVSIATNDLNFFISDLLESGRSFRLERFIKSWDCRNLKRIPFCLRSHKHVWMGAISSPGEHLQKWPLVLVEKSNLFVSLTTTICCRLKDRLQRPFTRKKFVQRIKKTFTTFGIQTLVRDSRLENEKEVLHFITKTIRRKFMLMPQPILNVKILQICLFFLYLRFIRALKKVSSDLLTSQKPMKGDTHSFLALFSRNVNFCRFRSEKIFS